MEYIDEIVTISVCRGEIAASLGERGLMVRNWSKLKSAIQDELVRETPHREDGHSGSSAVGDLLFERVIDRIGKKDAGIADKPNSGPRECWPFEEKWFNGINSWNQ